MNLKLTQLVPTVRLVLLVGLNVGGAELVDAFDAASAPMQHRGAEAKAVDGAYAPQSLVGSSGSIMLWGPYQELAPGRYLVVYRFRFLEEVKGDRVCFVDVCHRAVTFSGRRPGGAAVPGKVWNEVAVPLDVPQSTKFEFRFWPPFSVVGLVPFVLRFGFGWGTYLPMIVLPSAGVAVTGSGALDVSLPVLVGVLVAVTAACWVVTHRLVCLSSQPYRRVNTSLVAFKG